MILTLHSLALGAVLSDGKHHGDKAHGYNIQVRPVGEVRDAPGSSYDGAKADLQAGRAAQALDGFRRAVRETPNSADALNGLAVTYDLLGRFDQSRVYYEAALVADPQSALVAYNYGFSLFMQRDFIAARPLLISAARSDDQAARTAARSALQQIADAPVDAPPSAPVAVARQSWIERTNEGEQRLVLDRPAPVAAGSAGAAAVAEIALTAPATAWTVADERRIDAAARLEALAVARAERLAARAAAAAASPQPSLSARDAPAEPQPAFAAGPQRDRSERVPPAGLPGPRAVDMLRAPESVALAAPARAVRRGSAANAVAGFHLMAADTLGDPARRRRVTPLQVGGAALMDMLAASLAAQPIGEPASRALTRLADSLSTIGLAAEAELPIIADGLDRLSSALGLWSQRG